MLKSLYRFLSPRFQTLFLEYPVELRPRYGYGNPAHSLLHAVIGKNDGYYTGLLNEFLTYEAIFLNIQQQADPRLIGEPHWVNGFFPGLDLVVLYGMLAHFRPGKYLEVGSGNSTKIAAKAVKDQNLSTTIISIDPEPRVEIRNLAHQVIEKPFESVELMSILELEENDILFIDNSHRVLPNSDAMVFFMEVLPMLKPGVIVHIHDIYLPYDYPQFMCDRFYSEQYMLAAFLMSNPDRYCTLMPNYYISEHPALKRILEPLWEKPQLSGVERHGGSFWLQIREKV